MTLMLLPLCGDDHRQRLLDLMCRFAIIENSNDDIDSIEW